MTKREKFELIGKVFATVEIEERDEILEFVEKEVAAIDNRNAKAKARAAEKRAVGDEIRDRIQGLMTEEPITIPEIVEALADLDLTPSKVTARATQLVKAGIVEKETVKVGDRKLVGYKLV